MEPWAAVRAPDTPARGPPGRASWWCRARPAHTARLVGVAHRETACGGLIHHRLSPSYGAPDPPTRRASPSTARGAFDNAPQAAHGMPGVVACRVPTPRAEIDGSRARHGRGARRSP